MKATFNQITENLVKVFTDKAESAQYYSDNEQYICLCGWCGTMSPVSRPAYIETFGKTTTEKAEVKAREIIAEKEAARQRTKNAQHAKEADRLEGVPAVGGFFWADNSGLKCDGGRGLFEELHALNYYTHAQHAPARLCCVAQVFNVSNEEFARPGLADELVTCHNLQGFARSEDVDKDDNTYNNDPEKLATFYTVGALVVSPSGKYYLIDSEGYSYARYIYVPIEWPVMLADEVAAVKAEEDARKAKEERQEAEAKALRLAQYRARCAKWSHLMQDVRPLEADPKTTSRQLMNARKANILAMCRAAFPGVKFSLKVRHGWGADFELSWTDGPTVEEFNAKTDLALFCRCRDTFDGWDDSTGVDYAEFADFARLTMGSNGGDIKTERVMSDEARAEILAQIFEAVPPANVTNKYGYTEAYTYTNKEAEAVAAALGVDVFDIFKKGYSENAETIARRAWNVHSYTKTTTPEPTDPKPGKAQAKTTANTEAAPAQDAAQTDTDAPAEGLQLVATAEGVTVIGDSRTTYRNRKAIKAHGATWNKTAQQWQASEPEAVASLREWFGMAEPETDEQPEQTHSTESDTMTETADTADTVQAEDEQADTATNSPVFDAEGVELLRERMQAAQDRDTAAGLERLNAAFASIFRTLSDAVAAAQAETDRTKKADEVHQLREEIGTLSAEIAGMTERLQVLAQRLAELEAEQPDTATGNAATAAEVAEESTTQGERFDRLDLLRNAAEDVERKTADNDHTGATLATLYALAACGVQVADLVPELRTIEANHHTRGYITPEEQQQRQAINDKARQRAAEVLTPEEWRTLYNTPHPKTSETA